jgi:uncharacterized protein YbjT (DUF2867 family)
MSGHVLVIGATGNVGLPLVKALQAKGATVRAASRSGKPVAGAAGVAVDIADPASFNRALDGVDRIYLLAPTGTLSPKETLLPLIEAAAARKVKVVLQSVFGVEADDAIPYRQVEIALERSGTPFVILRPNWFADNFHIFWKAGIDHGTIAVPAADGRSSFIDVRDIADAAAAALTSDRFDGKAFNLTGPAALGYADAAAILSSAIGRPVAYTPIDDAAFIDMLAGAGVPRDYAAFLASIFHPVREGWTATVTDAVPVLTGHPARSVEDYARDNAARFAA